MKPDDCADFESLSPIKKALHTIERIQAKLDGLERTRREPVAVIGIGCRFPGGGDDPDSFWHLLQDGRDAVTDVPADRLDLAGLFDPDPDAPGKMYMRTGGFLDRVDGFDAPFFRISPREASQMDPQQRLFLEVAWEALENAGQPPDRLSGTRTGVFAGLLSQDYAHLPGQLSERVDAYYYPGINGSFVAGRLSYVLGLHGPSIVVDTACSSSLVAVHLACQSLRAGETDVALAGGVNLILSPEVSMFLCKAKAMSPTGRCRAFDKLADGMIRGEGCGVVVLKRLTDAIAAGDEILAVIRGSAVNHDGASGGLTVPNPEAQKALYRDAMASAGVGPLDVCYVEAHGTGTHLGDPIELEGLAATYCEGRAAEKKLWIGSVKTNIGHTDSAAGIANLIKAILILRHRTIPPTLHFNEPNPQFAWSRFPIAVADRCLPLPQSSGPHRVGVTAFGLSGVNAHVILEEAPATGIEPPRVGPPEGRRACLLPISARSPEALRVLAASYCGLLSRDENDPEDICAAAASRRASHDVRLAVAGGSADELVDGLSAFLKNESSPAVAVGPREPAEAPRLVFVFSGQGAQWWGMGRELIAREPVFREALERVEEIFRRESGWSLLDELGADESGSRIHDTAVAQPAMFAVQVALVELWKHWGVHPHAVVGHSMGEVAAAWAAGVLTLEDAVRVIYQRGRLLEYATGRGKMAAASLTFDAARDVVGASAGRISIAAYNGPTSVVLSGDEPAMDAALSALNDRGVFCRELQVKFASHCSQMDAYQVEFEAAVSGIRPRASSVPLVSTVTGRLAAGDDYMPSYWARNIREPVLFATAIEHLLDEGYDAFLEIDPHPILGGSIAQCLESRGRTGLVLKSLHREMGERQSLLESLAVLNAHGVPLDFAVFAPRPRRRVALPTYPWQRKRYWLNGGPDVVGERPAASAEDGSTGGLLGERIASPLETIQFRSRVRASSPDYLEGHRIAGEVVFPGSAYVVMALCAAEEIGGGPHVLRDLSFVAPLVMTDRWTNLHVAIDPEGPLGERAIRIHSASSASRRPVFTLHAAGRIGRAAADEAATENLDPIAVRGRCSEISVDDFYGGVLRRGYQYSGRFRAIEALWKGRGEVLGRMRAPGGVGLHAALLDACMHAALAAVEFTAEDDLFVPVCVGSARMIAPPRGTVWTHATIRPAGVTGDAVTVDVGIFDETGRLCVELTDLTLRHAIGWAAGGAEASDPNGWCYEVAWVPKPIEAYASAARPEGTWLVVSDDGPDGAALARAIEAKGQDLAVVSPCDRYERRGTRTWTLDVRQPEHFRRLLDELREAGVECSHIMYLAVDEPRPPESVVTAARTACGGVLHLVQAVERAGMATAPRLWLVTRNAQATGDGEPAADPGGATLWGLARVIRLEHPDLGATCIDLDARGGGDQSRLIVREIQSGGGETQVAFRRGVRRVARLERHRLAARAAAVEDGTPRRARIASYGILDDLALVPMERRLPGPDEVEIRVRVTGLNFRDVLNALGMLEAYAKELGICRASEMPFGHECAGEIVAVGADVTGLRVGDEVVTGMATGSLASFVTVPAEFVVRRPAGLSREDGATLPVAFLTAHHALHHLAKIGPGDSVLVHSAAGGVGQAAVQLVRRAGGTVYATASPAKWDFVRSLGVERVMNSRTTDFADEIMEATAGRGVDVVVNSLSGEFVSRSLDVCVRGGRFVELGRIDILAEDEARRRRPDLAYHALALPDVARTNPGLIGSTLREIVRLVGEGELTPLPRTVYPIGSAVAAFRFMAQARHIGKVLVSQESHGDSAAARPLIRDDGTYLVSGGLGALGLRLARWLVDRGARHLVLAGRRGAIHGAVDAVRSLERSGARVVAVIADVAHRDDVARILRDIETGMPPLRGVFHAAVVVDDGVLTQQSLERFDRVFDPKAAGAWNLHLLTRDLPLEHFVCFSSMVAMLGAPGQGNYAAANAFLDALAHHRRRHGLAGLSVNWGPWAQSGLAAELGARDRARWAARGVEPIPPDDALELLGRLLGGETAQVGVLPVDWARYLADLPAPWSFLDVVSPASAVPQEETLDLLRQLEKTPVSERRAALSAHVRLHVARVLGLPSPDSIRSRQRLFDLGLDSLMAVELRNRLARTVGGTLRSTLVFDYPTVEALVAYLADNVLGQRMVEADDTAAAAKPPPEPQGSAHLDELSRDELADLLARELGESGRGDAP